MFIIFGSGKTGEMALHYLGWGRVICFASSYDKGENISGKKIISYEEMLKVIDKKDCIIVVASMKYNVEMVKKLQKDNVTKFFVYRENDPSEIWMVWPFYWLYGSKEYISYKRVLSLNKIKKYNRIAIYGDNYFLPYLISEIAIQAGYNNLIGIIPTSNYIDCLNCVGVPLCSLDELEDKIDCLVINKRRHETDVFDFLYKQKLLFDIVDIYDVEKFEPEFNHIELKKLKNIHKGKRCFIVGNGPSLRVEDLEKLHENGDICFGFNRIYRVYGQTKWRANYLGISDYRMIDICYKDIDGLDGTIFVSDVYHRIKNPIVKGVQYFHLNLEEYNPYHPAFSDSLDIEVKWGCTVTYDVGLQFAAYMGFSEIYLIGCDCSDFGKTFEAGNHFIDNYIDKNEYDIFTSAVMDWKSVFRAYESAEMYSRKNGFRIYNATRGGKLEVFERVDFDSLF